MVKTHIQPLYEWSNDELINSPDIGKLKYSALEPNSKRGLAAIRYGLIKEGITVDEHIRRVFEHYMKMGNLRLAAKEAASVVPDLKWDMDPHRRFYELVNNSNI